MAKGYLALVLHAHLPFVRHPEYDEFLEEDWLYQAITETYIPLIRMFRGLVHDKVPFHLTMSLTPTLISMLSDPLLQTRYVRYLDRTLELANKEVDRTRHEPDFYTVALMYKERLEETRDLFCNQYLENLVNAFVEFQDRGHLELITCGATHGYFPLMNGNMNAIRAQIRTAVRTHEVYLGRKPPGIWLPECAYVPGVEDILKAEGIGYFFVDTHGILYADPKPKYGVYAPVFCPNGVAAFARDVESSKQVWSSKEGYPGDFDYRDFYRDVGFDLDYDYIRPYIASTGDRKMTGIKYYRITGKTDRKEPYHPFRAMDKAAEHAGNFMFNRERQVEHLNGLMGKPPIVVAPYDAELFGHWWFEGPDFLNYLIRKIGFDTEVLELTTPGLHLGRFPKNQVVQPCMSSWGYKGYHEHWMSGENDWIYRHLHKAAERMVELAEKHPNAHGTMERALNQAARELLLAQASDWAFIMFAGTMVEYAVKRTKDHLVRFNKLYEDINRHHIDEVWLKDLELRDNAFPFVDYRAYL
ncbi:glycoside hydrolase family 57 protein [Nitrospina gracilis]|uniref:glycoside hydrolase family 57 protein n=1 Tax=Nitrospina gracilis TaxID=35801 RepID=UPI001F1C3A81|nr:1,4-alpha-glucan branching protein domain-containing protein [Nitrospina gracilis]MCF8719534.1 1,4-alpha-glucan branching enzyme [Nitrospina gracilis Nb-211]